MRLIPEASARPDSEAKILPALAVSRAKDHWTRAPILLVGLSVAALSCDLPIARFCDSQLPSSGSLRDLLALSEMFGHAFGVGFILWAIYLLDGRRRRQLPKIAVGSLGAGLVADVIKLLVSRTRPFKADLTVDNPLETFGQFLAFSTKHKFHSFPSAHTAVAVGLAVCLSVYYPKARPLFIVLAVLCGLHRLYTECHFLSDVLFGAAVGVAVALGCLFSRPMSRFFDWIERRLFLTARPGARAR